ncbi:MAG: hypothetical protein ABI813_04345 [Bacteroidota bacterium]
MTNLQLSPEEMKLVKNSDWILTKHRIIEKVYHLFGNLATQMQSCLQEERHFLPAEALRLPPKISKGEQYQSMPYVVLDYPRLFSKEAVFAIRSFFWWGNYFSITLHLKGIFHRQWEERINKGIAQYDWQDFYFSFSGNEFSFDLEGNNYISSGHLAVPGKETVAPFIKISYKIPFDQWDIAGEKLMQVFKRFIYLPGAD